MISPVNVLLVEDNPFDAELITHELRTLEEPVECRRVDSKSEFEEALTDPPDVVLIDYNLPSFDMFAAMEMTEQLGLDIPFIVVTGHVGDELAAECIKRGATDYVLKDRMGRLPQAVRTALEQRELKERARELQASMERSEARFRELVQNLKDVVAVVDDHGRVTYVSPGVRELTGYDPEDLIGASGFSFVHPEDSGESLVELAGLIAQPGGERTAEIRAMTKDGRSIWIEARAVNRLDIPSISGIVVNFHDITERKVGEIERASLLERQQELVDQLRLLLDSTGEGIYGVDAEGRCTFVNPAAIELLGYVAEEWIGAKVHDLIHHAHPDGSDYDAADCPITGSFKAGDDASVTGEVFWHKDGTPLPVEYSSHPLLQGEVPTGAVVVFKDVSARLKMESELRASEELFRNAFVAGNAGMALISPDNRYLSVNNSLCEMVGYTRDELMKKKWTDLTHPEDLESNVGEVEALLAGDRPPYHLTKRYIHKSGRIIWVEISDSVVRRPDGVPLYIVTQIQDVTERKRAEEALTQSQKLLRGVIDNSPALIYIKQLEGTYLLVSKTWLEAFDLDPADVVGKTDFDIFPEASAREYREVDAEVLRTLEAVEAEETATWADGSVHVYRSMKFPLFDHVGRCYALCGISEDVTERNRSEEERERLQAQLRQAQKMEAVGQLAGGIAHDFNNLLAVILNYAEFLTEDLPPDDPKLEDVREITRAGEKGAELVHQLLAFSRKEVVEPTTLDLSEVIQDLMALLRRSIGEHIELVVDVQPRSWVMADKSQLEQVVLNLAVNARDAMPDSGVLNIGVRSTQVRDGERPGLVAGGYVCLTVTDTGEGMDPETAERVFEPFFTTKERGEGTGLGLATVYGIVKQSGGGIYVESEKGKGSSFKIYLPLTTRGSDDEVSPEEPSEPTPQGQGRIVVVEDEAAVRDLVTRILVKSGYEVVALANGVEALSYCRENLGSIDLLLTDVVMPEMSGKALVDAVEAMGSEVKTIFMSGYTDEIIARRGILGASENLLKKPFKGPELIKKVRTVMGAGQ